MTMRSIRSFFVLGVLALLPVPAFGQTGPQIDLGVWQYDSDPVMVGDSFEYYIEVQNAGTLTATNVQIQAVLEGGGTYETVSPPLPAGCSVAVPPAVANPTLTCNVGTLAPLAWWYVYIFVWAPDTAGTLTHTVTVSATETDPVPSNNVHVETTTVNEPLNLYVSSFVDAVDVFPGNGVCRSAAGECTLRAAIQEANYFGPTVIYLPPGTYNLTIAGSGEDFTETGDLDIYAPVRIMSDGAVINAAALGDRVLHFPSPMVGKSTQSTRRPEMRSRPVSRVEARQERRTGNVTALSTWDYILDGVTISGGSTTGDGGGILFEVPPSYGSLVLFYATISSNTAVNGGGIAVTEGYVDVDTSTIRDNTASGDGGGIFFDVNTFGAWIDRSTISENTAARGAGVFALGGSIADVTLYKSTLWGNAAGTSGGGLFVGATSAILSSSTVSMNSASEGGGIYSDVSSSLAVRNSTIFRNGATSGGAIKNLSSGTTIDNSILAGSVVPAFYGDSDCAGSPMTGNTNLSGDATCVITGTGNLASTNPLLGFLQDNGGPTETLALPPGSPAIDVGNCGSATTDQRGITRPRDGDADGVAVCDIGAFELVPLADLTVTKSVSAATVIPGDTLTFTITVQNLGSAAASSVAVTDSLPVGVTLVSAVPSTGSCTPATTISCSLGVLASGATETITIVTTASSQGSFVNQASVTAAESDPVSANNSASVSFTVAATTADLSITKRSPSEVALGETFEYVISIRNAGPAAASEIVVTDSLPTNVRLLGTSGSGWSCMTEAGSVICSRASLAAGASSTLRLEVRAPKTTTGRIRNEASVSCACDPSTSNNADSVTTQIVNPCPTAGPALLTPAAGADVTSPVSFSWSALSGAARYVLTIGAETRVLDGATLAATAALEPGVHTWSVAAEFDNGCATVTSSGSFTVTVPCPTGVPEPIAPLQGASVETSPVEFRWTPVTGAESYALHLSINEGSFQLAGTVPGTAEEPALSVAIPAGATVSWYVEALFAAGCPSTRSATVPVNVACYSPVLSLQGEVTTGKPYQVRATIVSVGKQYRFEESDTEEFTTILASKTGEVDPTGEFVFTPFEHDVEVPTPFFYRVRLAQEGCAFSGVGRIVVVPLPSKTATEIRTVVQFENEEEISQQLFIPSPTPDRPTSYTFAATTDRDWMRVEPAAGTIGQEGVTLTVVTNPVGLPVGSNTGTVTLTFVEIAGAKGALQTTPVTGSRPVSVTLVTPVTNIGKDAPGADSLIIPAVAHATGINSEWQTDLRLLNTGATALEYALNLTMSGQDGTQYGKTASIELAAGQNTALNDVVKQWYGLGSLPGESATGVLEIRPLGPAGAGKGADAIPATRTLVSLASSRTYNRTPSGSLGEYVPAIPFASFVGGSTPAEGRKSVLSLQQLAQSAGYRTNLGLVEASGEPVSVEIRFYDPEGATLLTVPVSLAAGEHRQLNQVLALNNLTNVPTARAEVEITSGEGKVTAYASVVDNATGDPLQVAAVDLATLGAQKYVVPGVAHFDTGQARWRTDLQMFNAGAASVTARLDFYPVGASEPSGSAEVEIGPGRMRTLSDVVPTLFGGSNTGGAIQITTATSSELVITGRTYDQKDAGSYGQFMAAVTEDEAIALGDRAMQVMQLEESRDFRSNLAVMEVSGKQVRVELSAFPAESRVTPRVEFTLEPNEFRQFNSILKSLNTGTTYNARVALRVIGGDGKIVAYGSAVDNLTQDPTYIPGQ